MKRKPTKDPRRFWTSASNAQADELCPGRYRAQLAIEDDTSAAAQFGQQIHDAFAGEVVDLTVSQTRIWEIAEEICAEAVQRVFGECEPKVLKEKRLWTTIGNKYEHSGQCDRIYLHDHRAIIADLKSLRGEVALAPENLQLRDEATLLFLHDRKITHISVFICQPLVSRVPIICLYTRADHFLKMFEALASRVYDSHDPKAKRVPGSPQCDFCRARGTCAPAIKWSRTLPLQRAPSLELAVDRLKPEQLLEIWNKSSTIESILKEVERRLTLLTPLQLQSLGLRMNDGHMRQKINNPNELFRRLGKLGVKSEEFTRLCKVGIGDVSDLVRKKTGLLSKRLDQKVDDILSGITDSKRTKPSLEKTKP